MNRITSKYLKKVRDKQKSATEFRWHVEREFLKQQGWVYSDDWMATGWGKGEYTGIDVGTALLMEGVIYD